MQDAMKFWDGIAPKYAKSPIRDVDAYEYTLGRTRSYLKPSDSVLELGCGTGSTALRLADAVAAFTASDLSPRMLEIGAQKAREAGVTNITFVAAESGGRSLVGQKFDVVMGLNLFHLVEDHETALAEVHDLLPKGGLFISKTPCLGGRQSLKLRLMLMVLPVMQAFGKAPYVDMMAIDQWQSRIEAAGFEIIETGDHPAAPPNRYVVARRT